MMHYDKKEYERKIEESSLFSLDRDIQYTAYKKESLKMVEYLYCYLLSINENKYADYGYEITVIAERCIKSYDASKGAFIHYFNSAWKKEFGHLEQEKTENEKYRGLKITEDDKRSIRKMKKILRIRGIDTESHEVISVLSEAMNLTKDEVVSIINLYKTTVVSEKIKNFESDEIDIIDLFTNGCSAEEEVIHREELVGLLTTIDNEFKMLQKRQQPIISECLTLKICTEIENLKDYKNEFEFINSDILDEYVCSGVLPTQRSIGEKYGRDEASISRTLKNFIEKLAAN